MRKKQLPKIKKSLKTFILEEDAKVIDKSAIKVATFVTFLGLNFASHLEEANAGLFSKHTDHNDHANMLNTDSSGLHNGINPNEENIQDLEKKAITTAHGNHYNHSNESNFAFFGIGSNPAMDKIQVILDKFKLTSETKNDLNEENNN